MKLHKALLSEQDIRELIQMYVSSIKKNNMQRRERYKSMIWVRLADLGFDRPHIKRVINDLTDVDTEKDVDIIMSRYRLWGDDYADTFRATEATLVNALTEAEREEDEDGVEQNIKTYKMILQIPFATKKNKDQKLKKLKFDFNVLDIKVNKEKDGAVDTINPEAQDNPSVEYVVGLEIETEMTRSELENTLEPDYKILKLKEV
tara:strand:- start:685 stop:1296 length:612 start_codon:yes stop_codon:yes gene_type:complete